MGVIVRGEVSSANVEVKVLSETEGQLSEGFYEVESALAKRFSKKKNTYEYKVRFKCYGEDDGL